MSRIKQVAVLASALLLAACASGMQHLTVMPQVEYQQQQLSPRQFSLQATGPSMQQSQHALMLRAAEIARAMKIDWFAFIPHTAEQESNNSNKHRLNVTLVLGVGIRPTSSCSYRTDWVFSAIENNWNDPKLLEEECFTETYHFAGKQKLRG